MSDQGKNDTSRPSGRTWASADKIDAFREGWRARGAEDLAVLDEKGERGLAEYVRRTSGVPQ